MADPTIQTFCCHRHNITDAAVTLMQEFNSGTYNTVCIVSSSIGVLGAICQILPREDTSQSHRWFSLSATRGRQIVVWLAVADLLASLGVFVRSALWLNNKSWMSMDDDNSSVVFCAITSAWIQYFYTATWLWTLCYALDMKFVLREKPGHPFLYHMASWGIPAVLTAVGLSILYIPNANCHNLNSLSIALMRVLPNYCATYLPMALVMIANPILYVTSCQDVEHMIARRLGQFTKKERSVVDAIKVKFSFINLAFYICWLPNLINGALLWTLWFNLPQKIIIAVWYIMAVTNPLQALFNSLVYRRWSGAPDRLYIPCCRFYSPSNVGEAAGESTPLLQGFKYRQRSSCINGSSAEH